MSEPFPLSLGQEALWFLQQTVEGSSAYHCLGCARIASEVDLPACLTASPKPCTASTSARSMISRRTSCASRSVSRAMMKALAPNLTLRPRAAALAVISSIWALWPSGMLPFMKYQSVTRAAMARTAVEFPPWKISGCG